MENSPPLFHLATLAVKILPEMNNEPMIVKFYGAELPRLIFKCSSHRDQDNKHQNDKYLTLKGFVV